ncbi:acyl-CoA N-acyltransferase [Clohesyomyces aquaticus]|uniref:Acyl-CoA N-acyltransferase n=1 Tax=Clohesyomyces aquaticus TaxID=1231657 RepID=A0A1Y1ZQ12_9PLEO|nr:acyl-CoA N-acyltransferase [Clohesyomyces aquaticus]
MPQSSITAWLKKPTSVSKPNSAAPSESRPAGPLTPDKVQHQPGRDASTEEAIPTPSAPTQPSAITNVFSLPPLPPNVELVPLTADHIPAFKRLNALTLPVAYPAQFYTETLTEPHHSITLMALWHSTPPSNPPSNDAEKPHLIGAIRCRLLPSSTLYISTLCLLSPYRSHGIATHLLQAIVMKAAREHGVKCVTAHVWEANDDGLEWYEKRGFETLGKEEGYYRKLKPGGAVLVRKWIGVGDFLGGVPNSTPKTTPPKTTIVPTTKKTSTTIPQSTDEPEEPPPTKTVKSTLKSSQKPPTKTQTEEIGPSSTRCPVPLYYKCGGTNDHDPWTGCTKCVAGAVCVIQNEWYYQCVAEDSVLPGQVIVG